MIQEGFHFLSNAIHTSLTEVFKEKYKFKLSINYHLWAVILIVRYEVSGFREQGTVNSSRSPRDNAKFFYTSSLRETLYHR
ncbi:hypothetical protein C789_3455 [Microcystis aeruginosa FACHB-905 = DIANCHI905]|nr:hypothetical protein C789_3455 [Microcystis aeruginosa FACHB-905 = DIANCHI905]